MCYPLFSECVTLFRIKELEYFTNYFSSRPDIVLHKKDTNIVTASLVLTASSCSPYTQVMAALTFTLITLFVKLL